MFYTTEDQTRAFHNEQQLQGLQIPSDDDGHCTTIYPWQVCSVYESPNDTLYHLHPELVDVNEFGNASVHLCLIDMNKIKKNCIPPFSIAAGIDFGHY